PRQLGRARREFATHDGGFHDLRTANSESRNANCESRNANCESQTWNLETSKLDFFRLPLLVRERSGYQNLCRLITRMKLRAPKYPLESHPETIAATTAEELAEFSRGLICLTGGDEGPLAAALGRGGIDEGRRTLEQLVRIFGHENV